MRVDLHSHAIPRTIVEAIAADGKGFAARIEGAEGNRRMVHDQGYVYPLFDEFLDPAAKLAAMDRKGLDLSVVSTAPPMFYYWAPAELAAKAARLVNDGIAEFVAAAPDRLRGMASVPMQHPELAVAELERAVNELGFSAVEIGTTIEGVQLADPRFRPFLRRARELDVLVFIHPYYVGSKAGLEDYYLTNLAGNPFDTTLAISHLIFSGALDELAGLKILAAHGGGYAPYQIGRLEHGQKVRAEPKVKTTTSPKALLKALYFDTVLFDAQALRHLIDVVGADHVCLGTDAPFDMGDETPLASLDAVEGLSEAERDRIGAANALALLGEG
ncbi:amidohydrolase family protein [Aquabacter sp. P-9]|uniref:amidohydrolase family protein n=1 Tax=Aquabacter sediminis TaxID=3029197 RepID=UPI00237EAE4A|nr:amidohydrolase family protein [Aquabacter sp. P-9]MDE1570569.1 amidohydrolase family protein [Aquabacter sp. P-9]